MNIGDRVLFRGQAQKKENGIYRLKTLGVTGVTASTGPVIHAVAAVKAVYERTTDADATADFYVAASAPTPVRKQVVIATNEK